MTYQRGPYHSDKCACYINPTQPLIANRSVTRCVKCVSCGNDRLQHMKTDLQQLAYLIILENSPKYNPDHHTGASYTTFIRSRVCAKPWNERKKIPQWRFAVQPKWAPDGTQIAFGRRVVSGWNADFVFRKAASV